jgi:hypothetical protein
MTKETNSKRQKEIILQLRKQLAFPFISEGRGAGAISPLILGLTM